MIWFIVNAPPERILQVSQWLQTVSIFAYFNKYVIYYGPEDVICLVVVESNLPFKVLAMALSLKRSHFGWFATIISCAVFLLCIAAFRTDE